MVILYFCIFNIFSVDKVKRLQRWCHFVKVLDLESWEEMPREQKKCFLCLFGTKQPNNRIIPPPDRSSASPRPPPAPAIIERLSNHEWEEQACPPARATPWPSSFLGSPAYLDVIVNKSRSHHLFWLFFIFTSVRRFAALLIRDRNLWTQQSSPSVATEKRNQIINGLTWFPGSTYSHPGSTFPTWHQNWHHAIFLPTESSPWKDYWYFDLV